MHFDVRRPSPVPYGRGVTQTETPIKLRSVRMSAEPAAFKVADLSLAEFGRKEIRLAEHEMPRLMAMRGEYAGRQPLRGARITGSLHMTQQTAVPREALTALGGQRR